MLFLFSLHKVDFMVFLIISILAITIIALISSAFCHFFIKKSTPAHVASVVYTNLTFHALAFFESGTTDPNWLVTSLLITLISIPIALVVGRYLRRWKAKRLKK